MKFKILKKFSKISKFSQIISCRQHWLWNHVICQDWWVKSIDFGVNSSKMGKLSKIKYFNWLSTVNRKSHECSEVLEHAQILRYSIRWFFEGWRDFYAHFHRKRLLNSWENLKKWDLCFRRFKINIVEIENSTPIPLMCHILYYILCSKYLVSKLTNYGKKSSGLRRSHVMRPIMRSLSRQF